MERSAFAWSIDALSEPQQRKPGHAFWREISLASFLSLSTSPRLTATITDTTPVYTFDWYWFHALQSRIRRTRRDWKSAGKLAQRVALLQSIHRAIDLFIHRPFVLSPSLLTHCTFSSRHMSDDTDRSSSRPTRSTRSRAPTASKAAERLRNKRQGLVERDDSAALPEKEDILVEVDDREYEKIVQERRARDVVYSNEDGDDGDDDGYHDDGEEFWDSKPAASAASRKRRGTSRALCLTHSLPRSLTLSFVV